jgi:hypothetical protein
MRSRQIKVTASIRYASQIETVASLGMRLFGVVGTYGQQP